MVQLSLESVINIFLRDRDYPFHNWAFLSKPNYIDAVPYSIVETKHHKTTDYIFFERRPYIDTVSKRSYIKPSLTDPVFILTLKNSVCTLKSLPYTNLNSTVYKPKFKESTKYTVYAAIKIARELNFRNIIIEDNTYIIGINNNCIPYSDLQMLFTGQTWYKTFLPIKTELFAKTQSWYQIKHIMVNILGLKQLNPLSPSDEIKIGSAYTMLKQLAKNRENYIIIKNNIVRIFEALRLESQYKKILNYQE
jgi:hypothetical protein